MNGSLKQVDNDSIIFECNEIMARKLAFTMVLFCLISIFGTVGNMLSIYVFSTKMNRNFQNSLLLLLSASSLWACAVSIPGEIIDVRYFYMYESPVACKVMRFFNTYSTVTTCLTLIVLAVYRLQAMTSLKNTTATTSRWSDGVRLGGILLVSAALSWPAFIVYGLRPISTGVQGIMGQDCSTGNDVINTLWPLIFYMVLVSGYLVLLLITVVVYYRIWRIVKRSRLAVTAHAHQRKMPTMEAGPPVRGAMEDLSKKEKRRADMGCNTGGERKASDQSLRIAEEEQVRSDTIRIAKFTSDYLDPDSCTGNNRSESNTFDPDSSSKKASFVLDEPHPNYDTRKDHFGSDKSGREFSVDKNTKDTKESSLERFAASTNSPHVVPCPSDVISNYKTNKRMSKYSSVDVIPKYSDVNVKKGCGFEDSTRTYTLENQRFTYRSTGEATKDSCKRRSTSGHSSKHVAAKNNTEKSLYQYSSASLVLENSSGDDVSKSLPNDAELTCNLHDVNSKYTSDDVISQYRTNSTHIKPAQAYNEVAAFNDHYTPHTTTHERSTRDMTAQNRASFPRTLSIFTVSPLEFNSDSTLTVALEAENENKGISGSPGFTHFLNESVSIMNCPAIMMSAGSSGCVADVGEDSSKDVLAHAQTARPRGNNDEATASSLHEQLPAMQPGPSCKPAWQHHNVSCNNNSIKNGNRSSTNNNSSNYNNRSSINNNSSNDNNRNSINNNSSNDNYNRNSSNNNSSNNYDINRDDDGDSNSSSSKNNSSNTHNNDDNTNSSCNNNNNNNMVGARMPFHLFQAGPKPEERNLPETQAVKGKQLQGANTTRDSRRLRKKSHRKTAEASISKMAFLLTSTFLVSFTPFFCVVLPTAVAPELYNTVDTVQLNLVNTAIRFYFVTSALNPVIFWFTNAQFQEDVRHWWIKCHVFPRCCTM